MRRNAYLSQPSRQNSLAVLRLAAAALAAVTISASAQDIEPRSYSNAPIGVNFLVAGGAYTQGGLAFDTALPVTDVNIRTWNAVVAYARVIDIGGQSGRIELLAPYVWLNGSADYNGQPVERVVNGPGDPIFRISANFYGAPAMSLKEFAGYEQDLIIGGSLRVIAPLGQYDDTRVVNIGMNRWSFKPELGVSKAIDQWTFELTAAATFFTRNTDFYGGGTREQDPIYSTQWHMIYSFPNGVWSSFDATYFVGGRTTINGARGNDLQQNWRIGGTLAFPVDMHNSIKLYASSGVSDRTGNSFDMFGLAWQYRWGGGL